MLLARAQLSGGSVCPAVLDGDDVHLLDMTQVDAFDTLTDILHAPKPIDLVKFLLHEQGKPTPREKVRLLKPIDAQEVWAAGVTYKRSQVARMEESESAASHYDQVYSADRPELFAKGPPRLIADPGDAVRVRWDSGWSVPEPEFTLVLNPDGEIVGYTIGNDMSARDIEGENPLYLPQAKVYDDCCSVGPAVLLADEPLDLEGTTVELVIERASHEVFRGDTNLGQLNRKLEDLADWLFRELSFPDGALLLTGTGIVPPDDFTLEDGDMVHISVTGIGTLTNPVVKQKRD